MKTLQYNIEEALFSKGPSTLTQRLDASWTIPSPKNEKDYLAYMSAWAAVFLVLFQQDCFKDNHFESYVFELYFANLPNYHLDGTRIAKERRNYSLAYDANWDEGFVVKGKLQYDKAYVDKTLKAITSEENMSKAVTIGAYLEDSIAVGKQTNTVPTESWAISRRADALLCRTYTSAKGSIKNIKPAEYYEQQQAFFGWLETIHETMKNSLFKDKAELLFKVISSYCY